MNEPLSGLADRYWEFVSRYLPTEAFLAEITVSPGKSRIVPGQLKMRPSPRWRASPRLLRK